MKRKEPKNPAEFTESKSLVILAIQVFSMLDLPPSKISLRGSVGSDKESSKLKIIGTSLKMLISLVDLSSFLPFSYLFMQSSLLSSMNP